MLNDHGLLRLYYFVSLTFHIFYERRDENHWKEQKNKR